MLAARLTAQLLAGPPARTPLAVAERLLAIQAQDPRGARLAVRARTREPAASDLDRALTDERSLVVTWLNRGTLHLVRSEDLPWLQALTTPPLLTGNARRLAEEGVPPDDADRGVRALVRTLEEEGPLTREQLRRPVAAAGVRAQGQALAHILMLASLRGLVVRGPMDGRQHAYVLVRDWLGEPPPVDRAAALAELARRYLAGHGPAGERDLARWAGLPLRDVRAGLSAIAGELVEHPGELLDLARRPEPAELPPPRLLGAFEPLLLGWRDREPILGPHSGAVVAGGIFRAFGLVGGRAAATWRIDREKVDIEPLEALDESAASALAADAADVLRYLAS